MERSFCFSLFFLFFRLVWAKIFCAWDLMILSFFYMLPCVQELVKFLKTHEYSPSTLPCGIPWGMAGFSMEWLSWSIRGHKVLFLGSRKCLPSWLWDADRERGLLLRCRCDSLLWMTVAFNIALSISRQLPAFPGWSVFLGSQGPVFHHSWRGNGWGQYGPGGSLHSILGLFGQLCDLEPANVPLQEWSEMQV